MKRRTLTSALLIAGVSAGVQAFPQDPVFTEALELEERFGYSLIEAMLSIAAMTFEHTGDCDAEYDADVRVSKNGNIAEGTLDDLVLHAEEVDADQGLTKGTKIHVFDYEDGEVGDTWVDDVYIISAYDFYGTIAVMNGDAYLDGDMFDEHVIKDFWEVDELTDPDPGENFGHSIVLDHGYEAITKFGFPRSKWDQSSYLWRSNGGNGYILIEKHLIAPDPERNPCWMTYTALVGDLGAGFQTIGATLEMKDYEALE